MNRIHQEELDWGKIYGNSWQDDGTYYYDEQPFTGIMFDTVGDVVIAEAELVDGLLDGVSRQWNHDGDLVFEGVYKNGYAVGVHRYWHDGNVLHKEIHYGRGNEVIKKTIHHP